MSEAFKFLGGVLEKGGVVAALFFVVIFAFGFAIRALWKKNQEVHAQVSSGTDALKKAVESHARKVEKLQGEHAQSLRDLVQRHTDQLKAVAEQHTREKRLMGQRIDELQEIRVTETRSHTESTMAYIQNIDQFVTKLETVIDVLMNASRK